MNTIIRWKINKRNLFIAGIGILAILILYIVFKGSGDSNLPIHRATRGDFSISLTETGELSATNSVVIAAPPVRGSLQIIYLAPKGEEVLKGDTLVVFDGTDWQKSIEEAESKLEIARANLDKSKASKILNMAQLQASHQSAEASYRLAELRLEQMKFEADVKKEEQELSLLQSEINLEKARSSIEQQKTIDAADLKTIELQVKQAEADLEKARRDLGRLTILAPQPGLVVYKKIWKGGDISEVKIGDTPWRGQAMIELPDLSKMEVETSVNEVDVARIKSEQKAEIVLDAHPDQTFTGVVTEVSNLARIEEESLGEVKVFDVVIGVDANDPILKPGMTVSSTIMINTIPDVVYIPLDAVFSDGPDKIVFRGKSGFKPVKVTLGERNDNYVVVTEGLEDGDYVCLVNPTKPFDPSTRDEAPAKNEEQVKADNGDLDRSQRRMIRRRR